MAFGFPALARNALLDALTTYAPDELVVSTFDEGRSRWLEDGVVDAVRSRFDGPVTHVTEQSPA